MHRRQFFRVVAAPLVAGIAWQSRTAPVILQQSAQFGQSLFVGLSTHDGEVTGGSYRRMPVRLVAAPEAKRSLIYRNADAIQFPAPTADWGVVTGASFYQQASGPDPFVRLNLVHAVHIRNGDYGPVFAPGHLTMTLTEEGLPTTL